MARLLDGQPAVRAGTHVESVDDESLEVGTADEPHLPRSLRQTRQSPDANRVDKAHELTVTALTPASPLAPLGEPPGAPEISERLGALEALVRDIHAVLATGAVRSEFMQQGVCQPAAGDWQRRLEASLEQHTASILAAMRDSPTRRSATPGVAAQAQVSEGDGSRSVSALDDNLERHSARRAESYATLGADDDTLQASTTSGWMKPGPSEPGSLVEPGPAEAGLPNGLRGTRARSVQFARPAGEPPESERAGQKRPPDSGLEESGQPAGGPIDDEMDVMSRRSTDGGGTLDYMFNTAGLDQLPNELLRAGSSMHAVSDGIDVEESWFHAVTYSTGLQKSCFTKMRRSLRKPLDMLSTVVLLANVLFVTYITDGEMRLLVPEERQWAKIANLSFTAFFVVELLLRLCLEGKMFFTGPSRYWNCFDSVIVGLSLIVESGFNFLRSLRVLRVAKVVRSLRLVTFLGVKDLEKMINGLTASMNLLAWCTMMILFLSFLFAVFFVQGLSSEIVDGAVPRGEDVENIRHWFGSVGDGVVSLIMVVTGGTSWEGVYAAVSAAGVFWRIMLVTYVILFAIAVWNVVTSIFVDKAMKFARLGDENTVLEQQRHARRDVRELQQLFKNMDVDCSGTIDCDEFAECIKRPEFAVFLRSRGLDIHETKVFFSMLQGKDKEELSIAHIASACIRLRGMATSIDLHMMRYELRKLLTSQMKLLKKVNGMQSALLRSRSLASDMEMGPFFPPTDLGPELKGGGPSPVAPRTASQRNEQEGA